MKKLFQEADVDNSGFLSMEEIYNLFNLNLGIEITREELDDAAGLIGCADANYDQ